MPRISKAQATANLNALKEMEAKGQTPAAPVADAPLPTTTVTPKATSAVVIPPPPPGMDKAVWEKYFLDNLASKVQTAKSSAGRVAAGGITELTIEAAQKIHDAGNIAASIRAGKLGTVEILPTTGEDGCYSLALVQNNKVVNVEPAHVDRVKSPRHLPRALRLAGTWIGEHAESGFSNGPTGKNGKSEIAVAASEAAEVTVMDAQAKDVAPAAPRAAVPTAADKAAEIARKADAMTTKNAATKQAASKTPAKNAAKKTSRK